MIGEPHSGFTVGQRVSTHDGEAIVTSAQSPYYDVKLVGSGKVKKNLHYVFINRTPPVGSEFEETAAPVSLSRLEGILSGSGNNNVPGEEADAGADIFDEDEDQPEPLVAASLMVFHRNFCIRRACMRIMRNSYFNGFILFLIATNTVFMAGTDFRFFNHDNGDIIAEGLRNKLVIYSEPIFVSLFAIEATIKIIALGFYTGKRAYIKDPWNKLDFIVVCASILEAIPQVPKLSMLRCFRVLRPLRSISRLPKLKMQIIVLGGSIRGLSDVLLLIASFIFLFALFGVQLWGAEGRLHGRCRSALDPLRFSSGQAWAPPMEPVLIGTQLHFENMTNNSIATQCVNSTAMLGHAGLARQTGEGTWGPDVGWGTRVGFGFGDEYIISMLDKNVAAKAEAGVYNKPKKCGWPFTPDEERGMDKARLCNLKSASSCPGKSVCGSNYDDWGRQKFLGPRLGDMDLHVEGLNWGLSRFDNVGWAMITIFQTVTLEGWTDIMYQVQDATGSSGAYFFFSMVVLGGSFFMLNLALAIVFNVMCDLSKTIYHDKAHELIKKIFAIIDDNGNGVVTFEELAHVKYYQKVLQRSPQEMRDLFDEIDLDGSGELSLDEFTIFSIDAYDGDCELLVNRCISTHKLIGEEEDDFFAKLAKNSTFKAIVNWKIMAFNRFVEWKWFDTFITWMIIANIIVLACDRFLQPQREAYNLELFSFCLTIIFGIELFAKLLGLGLKEYFADNFNTFDAVITTLSIMEVCLVLPNWHYYEKVSISGFPGDLALSSGGGGISALRTFRLFRLVRLLNKFEKLKEVTDTALMMMPAVSSFFGLVLILIFILALFGQQLLANKMRYDQYGYRVSYETDYEGWLVADVPTTNYDDLLSALLATFQIVTGEDWNVVFYQAVRADGWLGGIYVLFVLIIGSLLLLNLLIAVMLDQFERARIDKERNAAKHDKKSAARQRGMLEGGSKHHGGPHMETVEEAAAEEEEDRLHHDEKEKEEEEEAKRELARMAAIIAKAKSGEARMFVASDGKHSLEEGPSKDELKKAFRQKLPAWRKPLWDFVNGPLFNNFILFLIVVSSVCLALENPLYDPDTPLMQALQYMDYVLTGFFVVEMVLKMVALGVYGHPYAYFSDVANWLDFFIVAISLVTIGGVESLKSLRVLRCLRALRPLRMVSRNPSMRVVLSALIQSIPHVSYVSLFVGMVFLLFAILGVSSLKGTFGACLGERFDGLAQEQQDLIVHPVLYTQLAVEQQQGWAVPPTIRDIKDPLYTTASINHTDYVNESWAHPYNATSNQYFYLGKTSRAVCLWMGAEWGRPIPQNFDDVPSAFLALFQICTTEGWVMVMQQAMDATSIDMQPINNANRLMCVFFVVFMLVGIFMTNLFVGVLVDNFARLKANHSGHSVLLTDDQEAWLLMQKMMIKAADEIAEDVPPESCVRAWCWECSHVTGQYTVYLDGFISFCIMFNVALLASNHFGQDPQWTFILEVFNVCFVFIFTFEALIKITGLGFCGYWLDWWNRFDFVLVVVCDIGLVVAVSGVGGNLSGLFTILRVLRVLRFVRVLRSVPTLKALITTIILMIPSLGNIFVLMLLMFFIYAVLGVQLFAEYGYRADGSYNEHANFRSFDVAMMTLLRTATGEYWNGIMHDLATPPADCQPSLEYTKRICAFQNSDPDCVPLNGCGKGPWIAIMYFTTFCVLVTFVFLNLFITVILESFENSMATAKQTSTVGADNETPGLTPAQYSRFCAAWKHFAAGKDATHTMEEDITAESGEMLWHMSENQFFMFISSRELGRPIGFGLPPLDAKLPAWWVRTQSQRVAGQSPKRKAAIAELEEEEHGGYMKDLLFGCEKTWDAIVRTRCVKLSMLPDDDGKYFFDDAAHGCAQLLMLEANDLLSTLDHPDHEIDKLAKMLAAKRKKQKKKGVASEIRQVVALSSSEDGDRTRERRKRKHMAKLKDQQQELMEDVAEVMVVDDTNPYNYPQTTISPRTEQRVRDTKERSPGISY